MDKIKIITIILIFISKIILAQISFDGYVLDYENNIPLKSLVILQYNNKEIKRIDSNENGFFRFDNLENKIYSLQIHPSSKQTIISLDTFYTNPYTGKEDTTFFTMEMRHNYCSIIKDSINLVKDTSINFYTLYTSTIHGDGFPRMKRILWVIPIPFIYTSACTYEASGGNITKYGKYIGNKITKEVSFHKCAYHIHYTVQSFHDIFIKTDNYGVINYKCLGGFLYW